MALKLIFGAFQRSHQPAVQGKAETLRDAAPLLKAHHDGHRPPGRLGQKTYGSRIHMMSITSILRSVKAANPSRFFSAPLRPLSLSPHRPIGRLATQTLAVTLIAA